MAHMDELIGKEEKKKNYGDFLLNELNKVKNVNFSTRVKIKPNKYVSQEEIDETRAKARKKAYLKEVMKQESMRAKQAAAGTYTRKYVPDTYDMLVGREKKKEKLKEEIKKDNQKDAMDYIMGL